MKNTARTYNNNLPHIPRVSSLPFLPKRKSLYVHLGNKNGCVCCIYVCMWVYVSLCVCWSATSTVLRFLRCGSIFIVTSSLTLFQIYSHDSLHPTSIFNKCMAPHRQVSSERVNFFAYLNTYVLGRSCVNHWRGSRSGRPARPRWNRIYSTLS